MQWLSPILTAILPAGALAAATLAPAPDRPTGALFPPWWPEERRIAAAAAAEAPILAIGRLGIVVLAPGARAPGALLHLNGRPGGLCIATWTRS